MWYIYIYIFFYIYTYLGYLRKFWACLVPCIPIWYSHGQSTRWSAVQIRQDSPPPADIQDRVIQRDDDTPETSRGIAWPPWRSQGFTIYVFLGKLWWETHGKHRKTHGNPSKSIEIHRNPWLEIHGDSVDDRIWCPSLRQPQVTVQCFVPLVNPGFAEGWWPTTRLAETLLFESGQSFYLLHLSNPKEKPELINSGFLKEIWKVQDVALSQFYPINQNILMFF